MTSLLRPSSAMRHVSADQSRVSLGWNSEGEGDRAAAQASRSQGGHCAGLINNFRAGL